MATFKSEFIDSKKNILIPGLQRDYVQGGREDVISPFLDELCSALKGEKNLDLNYIYGSDENVSFVPIDGQQRLITLWLLHLYLYTLRKKDFPVELHFSSREFADNFASKLKEELKKLNGTKTSVEIIDASWFVSGWLRDTTVQNMLVALDYIAKKCSEQNEYQNFDNITFSFLDMQQEDLTDDIYIKMNGRGRPLTYFENLKSWMEEKIVGHFGEDAEFSKEWQQKIDNEWTDFFWQNRDTTQPHPEEIDDEQERFFYNLLRIFWTKQGKKGFASDDNKESLCSILGISEGDNLEESILSRISKKDGFVLPLFVLEKTGLFSKDFFDWAKEALDGITKYSEQINEIAKQLEFDLSFNNEQTFCNKIFFSNENQELVIMSGIIDYYTHCNDTQLDEWLRFIRNVVRNIDDVSNNKNLLLSLKQIATKTKNRTSVLDVLSIDPKHYQGIPDEILQEEKTKATLIQKDKDWKSIIKELENNKYFTGQIKFMFDFLGSNPNKEDFKNYSSLMQSLFSGDGSGKYFSKDIDENLFSRALLCFTTSYGYGYQIGSNWSFLKSSKTDRNTWKKLISDAKQLDGRECRHNDCLKQLLDTIINEYKSNLSNDTLTTIIKSHQIKDWRKFFIEYPGVWKYINPTEKYIRWCSEHDIGLVRSIQYGASVYHAELRSYCLYLDYMRENPSKEKDGWKISFYEMENTCLVFDKSVGDKQVAIDVRFESENADSEDYYSLEIFLRGKEKQESRQYLKSHCDSFSESERGYKLESLTKDKIKEEVNKLLKITFS